MPLSAGQLTVYVDGVAVQANPIESAAAVVLRIGLMPTRTTPASGEARAPYCMMGVCFECLMTIDGVASRQACLTPVREGMRIERQFGPRALT
ncbi:MAG: (2Fe-2S)-binding protein [Burkholderiales bacterium]|nr:(2Fe-2S)-binding protein [Burkholderiales bacterium]